MSLDDQMWSGAMWRPKRYRCHHGHEFVTAQPGRFSFQVQKPDGSWFTVTSPALCSECTVQVLGDLMGAEEVTEGES